jgi:hypothetical protein
LDNYEAKSMVINISPQPVIECNQQAPAASALLKILAYFDLFDYPLTRAELRSYLKVPINQRDLDKVIESLVKDKKIFDLGGFYSLQADQSLHDRRKAGNARASRLMRKAYAIGRFLFLFPFVKGIGISGSLSKDYADKLADIDFFIITSPNRLWIARTILHCFKKLTFLTGHQHYFCMNYFIDEAASEIDPKNIFTAIEIVTLRPVAGKRAFHQFFEANKWAGEMFPYRVASLQQEVEDRRPKPEKITEGLFRTTVGDQIDNWFMRITRDRWKVKTEKGYQNKNGRTVHLVTGKHFCRSNPGAFMEKVLAAYEQKLKGLGLRE